MRGLLHIIIMRSWKIPCRIMIQLSTPLMYITPFKGKNILTDVNVIAHYPLLKFSTFHYGITMRQTLSLQLHRCRHTAMLSSLLTHRYA